jgi:arginyl-tRNA synthetase
LQYALARARSIIRKQSAENTEFIAPTGGYSQYERDLLFKITEYPHVVAQATVDFTPHHLCTYLYELAQVFNRFYENNKVIGDERENVRVHLVMAYASVLQSGLKVLGIPAPDRM